MSQQRFERWELKYYIHPHEMDLVRCLIEPFMHIDKYANGHRDGRYIVRSIYFDTPSMRFYHEKEAGTKIRRKLRVRTYNQYEPDSVSFLEIKRKNNNAIIKERVRMPWLDAMTLLNYSNNCAGPKVLSKLALTHASAASVNRFISMMSLMSLRPVVLVVYDREAYVGNENSRVRVTFDCDVRSAINPKLEDIFENRDLRHLTNRRQILEVKFDGVMPAWLRPVTSHLDRSHQAISKYCHGIDLWSQSDYGVCG
jgi:SPX domain protein involved in polyphosphate accumulation